MPKVLSAETVDQFNKFTVVAPTLDDNMRPAFQLQNRSQCPRPDKKGLCGQCEHFAGFKSEDGTVFACGAYEGFCEK